MIFLTAKVKKLENPPSGNHNLSPVPLFNHHPPPTISQQNYLVKKAFPREYWRSRKKEKCTWFSDRLMSSRPSASRIPTACIQILSTDSSTAEVYG